MVDGGGLENRCTRKGIGGSNPSPSATLHVGWLAVRLPRRARACTRRGRVRAMGAGDGILAVEREGARVQVACREFPMRPRTRPVHAAVLKADGPTKSCLAGARPFT